MLSTQRIPGDDHRRLRMTRCEDDHVGGILGGLNHHDVLNRFLPAVEHLAIRADHLSLGIVPNNLRASLRRAR